MLVCLIILALGSCIIESVTQSAPVYGYPGVTQALQSGKSLHFYVNLKHCRVVTGIVYPEFFHPFGGHVTKWRVIKEDNSNDTYISFVEQIPVLNGVGKLESLSREVRIFSNDTTYVTTAMFTPDYTSLTYDYRHLCTLSTPTIPGNIEFLASTTALTRLTNFIQTSKFLEAGEYVHFSARPNLCQGVTSPNLIRLGGRISNYELAYDSSGSISEIKVFVQVIYNFGVPSDFATVMDLTINKENIVSIVETNNSLPNYILEGQRVTKCPLSTSASGGVFDLYASL